MSFNDNKKIKLSPKDYRTLVFEIIMVAVSSFIVIVSFYDLAFGLREDFMLNIQRLDLVVISVFAIDLIFNFVIAKDKRVYLKKSIITILCVVPFSSFFRLAAVFRLNRIFSLFRSGPVFTGRIFTNIWAFFMKPSIIRISKFFNLARSYLNKNYNSNKRKNP